MMVILDTTKHPHTHTHKTDEAALDKQRQTSSATPKENLIQLPSVDGSSWRWLNSDQCIWRLPGEVPADWSSIRSEPQNCL